MLEDLYQELIIDHGTQPRNKREIENCSCQAKGHNPLCGDKISVFLKVDNNKIIDAAFIGEGCAISMASASIMSEALKDINKDDAIALMNKFTSCLTKDENSDQLPMKLQALAGVKQYPMRVKCATLAWHTFKAALNNNDAVASTE